MALAVSAGSSFSALTASAAVVQPGLSFGGAFEDIDPSIQQQFNDLLDEPEVYSLMSGDTANSLKVDQKLATDGVETTKFQHFYRGLEVLGSMAFRHEGADGKEIQNALSHFDLSTKPGFGAAQAVALAKQFAGVDQVTAKPSLKILPGAAGTDAKLVYFVELKGEDFASSRKVIVDAQDGTLIADLPVIESMADIEVYSAKDQGQNCQTLDQKGNPIAMNPRGCKLEISTVTRANSGEPTAKNAANNAYQVLQYYQQTHNRNSYDNRGGLVLSVIHAGLKYNNAFWNPGDNTMTYGDGDGITYGDFSLAVDVAGHEMTHGVTSHTARLLGMGESGALNEAASDFFGKMIANDNDWVIGRKIFLHPGQTAGIRNLQNPAALLYTPRDSNGNPLPKKPYPAHVKDQVVPTGPCGGKNDSCYVHINSTIPSHASFLVYLALGKQKAEKLMYLTLTQFLSPSANFKMMAASAQRACNQLGFGAADCSKVAEAYHAVGL